ncbi:hypothetical protein RBG61_07245 [Paludicola sp. MB14-C6]|uniref:hypothetical protein n=1 Tax=Paludihabitans sp. MB14-C6 TaxID=3070656 RepID=UPI0027DC73C1|nr:hypothetical protein [Paludicola sp. MB14-C6]WMJ21798.1 hypothetical protein RBG61_07245 [Paludicola sp. MB14-C6]
MKLKPCIKYNLHDKLLPISIFYIVFYGFFAFFISMNILKFSFFNYPFEKVELASLVFIFIMGLNSFKSPFLFQLSNGSSRKTVFTSFFACLIPISLLFSLTNIINAIVIPRFITFETVYGSLYGRGMDTADLILSFIWLFLLHIAVASLGYFITLLYYRMNTLLKYIVSFGIPLLYVIVTPIISHYTSTHYNPDFSECLLTLLGVTYDINTSSRLIRANPSISFITFSVMILFFAFFSFLLIRKAPLKQH